MKKSGPGKRNSSSCPPLPYRPSECPLCLLGCGKNGTAFSSPADLLLALPKRAKRPEGPSPLPSGTGRPPKSRCHFNHDALNVCLHFAARDTTDCPLGPAQYENIRCMAEHCSFAGTGTETARGAYPLPVGCSGPLFPLGTAIPLSFSTVLFRYSLRPPPFGLRFGISGIWRHGETGVSNIPKRMKTRATVHKTQNVL